MPVERRCTCGKQENQEHAPGCPARPLITRPEWLHDDPPDIFPGFTITFNEEWPTEQARVIMTTLLPYWTEEFLRKNRKYAGVDNSLGERGVFPDVWRKVGILKSRVWEGKGAVGEPTDEVIRDLIGHLFLMLYMRSVAAMPPETEFSWRGRGG